MACLDYDLEDILCFCCLSRTNCDCNIVCIAEDLAATSKWYGDKIFYEDVKQVRTEYAALWCAIFKALGVGEIPLGSNLCPSF